VNLFDVFTGHQLCF